MMADILNNVMLRRALFALAGAVAIYCYAVTAWPLTLIVGFVIDTARYDLAADVVTVAGLSLAFIIMWMGAAAALVALIRAANGGVFGRRAVTAPIAGLIPGIALWCVFTFAWNGT